MSEPSFLPFLLTILLFSSAQVVSGDMVFHAVAVGQGDGAIIQCPSGEDLVIVDMGALPAKLCNESYVTSLLKDQFGAARHGVRIHILVSHSDADHSNFFVKVLDAALVANVHSFIMGGTYADYKGTLRTWLKENLQDRSYVINNETECFGNSNCSLTKVFTKESTDFQAREERLSDPWQFCSGSGDVKFTVLGANLGTTPNGRSVILKVQYKSWSMLMSGDFETSAQKKLLDHYSSNKGIFRSDYYKVAHHGAWRNNTKPNLPALLSLIQPKKVYISHGYPSLSFYRHPNSITIDHLKNLNSIISIDPSTNAPFVYWDNRREVVVIEEGGMDRAIYQTCYSCHSGKEICHDIQITTNGETDVTQYINVPNTYYYNCGKLNNCPKSISNRPY